MVCFVKGTWVDCEICHRYIQEVDEIDDDELFPPVPPHPGIIDSGPIKLRPAKEQDDH